MPPLRCVSWAAVSSRPQTEKISLEDQKSANREHIARIGGVLTAELVVPGKSRNIVLFEEACTKIPAYAELRDLLERKAFDVLVYLDPSRLGRVAALVMTIAELCKRAGVVLYETERPPADLTAPADSFGDMVIGALGAIQSQDEIKKLARRLRMGSLGRIQAGKLARSACYGYEVIYGPGPHESRVVIKEPDATAVRHIFDWYLNDGLGYEAIAGRLNERGSHTPLGRPWLFGNVCIIVRRYWRYAGYTEINKQSKYNYPYLRAKATWEPLINEADALRVQEEQRLRSRSHKLANASYILTGVVWCITCGRPRAVSSHNDKRYVNWRTVDLRCQQAKHPQRQISYRKVMRALRTAMEVWAASDIDALLGADADPTVSLRQALAAQQAAQEAAAARLEREMYNIDTALARGILTIERYELQTARIESELAAVRNEMADLAVQFARATIAGQRRERIEDVRRRGLATLDSADIPAANAWLRQHVRIWVEANQVVEIVPL